MKYGISSSPNPKAGIEGKKALYVGCRGGKITLVVEISSAWVADK